MDAGMNEVTLRIGQCAEKAGVSTRTLRYYEELGLLAPSAYSSGGARRYQSSDIDRVSRIRQLQDLMGFDLDEIKEILDAEDRLAKLREEFYEKSQTKVRKREIVDEAIAINKKQRQLVRVRKQLLDDYADELERKARRYRDFKKDLESQ
jgi:DNA-binding transcriptional MerR regulator